MTFLSALMCGAFVWFLASRLITHATRKAPGSLQEALRDLAATKPPSLSPNALEGHMDPLLIVQAKLVRICVVMESLVTWEPPDDIEIQVQPYPPLGMVGVLLSHFGVICEVPLGCPCCAHEQLDVTVMSLIAQADPSEFRDRLEDAGRTFEQAIQEIER